MIEPYTGQFNLSRNNYDEYQFYSSRDSLKFSSEREGHYDFAAIYVEIEGERDKTLEATARMMAMSGVMYEMMKDYVDNGTKVSLDRMKEILEYIETDT